MLAAAAVVVVNQCFRAIREQQQLNANRPIEDGCNYCLAFALERYLLACHAQLSSVRVHLSCVFVHERIYLGVKPPGMYDYTRVFKSRLN